ncbi:hypothetical protein [Roseicella aerolata]|uniref:Uncharacterized protein n=1 Tax=Roseicella aerolata TaxID=2883479 RepID=A0A9X1IF51_9PROT|nr:hypothetical protein [Roseicella aerolata]MCB4823641.1 hypothetical protein [Roseicella aerolata]
MDGLIAGGSAAVLPVRGWLALRLVDLAVLMLRVAAILVLLSPLLGAAMLFA